LLLSFRCVLLYFNPEIFRHLWLFIFSILNLWFQRSFISHRILR
jgi:hypothetical protein